MRPFEYVRVGLTARLGKDGDTKLIAGGIDILGLMKDNIISPKRLASLNRSASAPPSIAAGERSAKSPATVHIDGLVTLSVLAAHPDIRSKFTALSEAAANVGSPQIRNVATVIGNLCQRPRCWYFRNELYPCLKKGGDTCYAEQGENKLHAIFGGGSCHIVHPSNLAPAIVAFDAVLEGSKANEPSNHRASEFFVGPQTNLAAENLLEPDEIVHRITLPIPPMPWHSTYLEFREKQDFDWPLASATVALQMDGSKCTEARVVLGAVAPIPWRAAAAEAALKGHRIDAKLATAAGEAATKGAEPMSQNGYKVQLVRTLVKRAVLKASGLRAED